MSEQDPTNMSATNKHLSHYEPFVELVAACMANGLAMAAQPDFLRELDRTVTLDEAFKQPARSFIKWRGAFMIDDIEASGS